MKRIASVCLAPIVAIVATAANADELDDRLTALERENASLKKQVRIEALERENVALRKKLTLSDGSQGRQAGFSSRQEFPKVASIEPVSVSIKRSAAPVAINPITPAPGASVISGFPVNPPLQPMTWTGFYIGSYFGLGRLRAKEAINSNTFSLFTNSYFNGQVFQAYNSSLMSYGVGSAGGSHTGGIGALSLGWQSKLSENLVAGIQVDGGLSNVQAHLSGSNTTVSIALQPPSGSSSVINSVADTLANRWFVSALAKGGFLVDPYSLIYILGGWSYANLEAASVQASFGANGVTIGAGIERRMSPVWSLKAEYRYTKFQNTTVGLPSNTSTSADTLASSSFSQTSARFNLDTHSALVGMVRSFDLY